MKVAAARGRMSVEKWGSRNEGTSGDEGGKKEARKGWIIDDRAEAAPNAVGKPKVDKSSYRKSSGSKLCFCFDS